MVQLVYTVVLRPYRSIIVNGFKILADFSIALASIFCILLVYLNEGLFENIKLDNEKLDTQYMYGDVLSWSVLMFLGFHALKSFFEFLISFFRFIFRDKNFRLGSSVKKPLKESLTLSEL